jgi:spore coat protein U-like protein
VCVSSATIGCDGPLRVLPDGADARVRFPFAPVKGAIPGSRPLAHRRPPTIRLALLTAALALLASKAEAQTRTPFACNVAATGLVFGTYTGSRLDSTGVIRLTCFGRSNDNPYAVALSEGRSNSFIDRLMFNGASNELPYNLYIDPSRTIIWGNGRGETQQHVGNLEFGVIGTAVVNLTVYGRIPAQARLPAPGSYADAILIIVTF